MKNQRDSVITSKDKLQVENTRPVWFDIIAKDINISKKKIKIGLVNVDAIVDSDIPEQLNALHPQVEITSIHFERVNESLKWNDFFPEWNNEDEEKYGRPRTIPMPLLTPTLKNYKDLNVVMAMVPCGEKEGIRDVFGLQVNLVVANLAVENGWFTESDSHRKVYVVFVGSCGPMVEIFRCDDLLMHQGEYWVYRPDLKKLKQKMLMPLGSCQIAPGYSETGNEIWRQPFLPQSSDPMKHNNTIDIPKLAYVTVLHSSEAHVCGAIVLAQSILQTGKTIFQPIDLLLLADESISPESIRGLKAAGWKVKRIQHIQNAKNNAYNYSKLRIWQLTMYDKIIFIDSNLLVVQNMDSLFTYPQLSASPNDRRALFNSGLLIVEPSHCMFEYMMNKTSKVVQGDDQGFLNEIFTWWHRLPSGVNYLKSAYQLINEKYEVLEDVYAVHYFGWKPWMCYRDYDCNWDLQDHHVIASDTAHQLWWQVHDTLPKELQSHCALTRQINERLVKMRKLAKDASLPDGHWKIEIKDPRKDEASFRLD
ncbi:putative UDP-glucuronate:xylan alpha-glucuronosyltransferase 4 [Lotus japonicus]|uniref:putative UDP-glucuronate:xylan alpha-glucuronosyltransferase 4 n=1 Tax=Lotus japonicus TaxID=34305 RepID=UPI002588B402|nr:putative UDP-glucuronate:xylan alpha-glucuronosyltransferase 4 [Lotus japonicus]